MHTAKEQYTFDTIQKSLSKICLTFKTNTQSKNLKHDIQNKNMLLLKMEFGY